jgi:beta-phosphoglucomutase-like phosphatase (HAD superfamily)
MPKFQGAIFDVDGVLVDSPHQKAWRESLRELMEAGWRDIRDQTTWSPDAFTPHVYQQYVSGKPRMAGARAALDYFHVPGAEQRVAEYAQHKQEMVVRLIEAGDFTAYPDALRFVIATKDAGMRIADASSSKNAGLFLRKIRLDTFAAEHVEPRHAMVIEDASSGVQAAKAGGMAAIGISRADDADLLAAADADLVVTSLDDVDRDALTRGELTTR